MLNRQIVLLDGGMGQELVHRAGVKPSPMWGAQVLMDQPDLVRELHVEYILAGARVITVNAYSVTPERLALVGVEDQFGMLQRRALELASDAKDKAASDAAASDTVTAEPVAEAEVSIAGCLPPLYGSYQPETFPGEQIALQTYRRIVEVQADSVDVFICETMSSVKECIASVTAASESGKPVWLGLSVNDNRNGLLRSGETIASAFDAVRELNPEAVLVNCSIPEAVTAAWPSLTDLPCAVGAYANGFTSILDLEIGGTVDKLHARTDLGPTEYASHAMEWVGNGASIVGGCCEISPAHIACLASNLAEAGYSVRGRLQG